MTNPLTYETWLCQADLQLRQVCGLDRPEARLRARLLLDHAVGLRHAHILHPESFLEPHQTLTLASNLSQVLSGKPLAYVLGRREFYGREFLCEEGALIPRPETELLVEAVLASSGLSDALRIVDLGTGTGCLAITLALELKHSHIYATDVSQQALKLAERNAALHDVELTLITGKANEWISPVLSLPPMDIIVSNPPYIPRENIAALQPEILLFEPHLALDGGEDGLTPYRDIAQHAHEVLAPGGRVALELGAGQFAAVATFFRQQGYAVEPPKLDFSGHERVLIAKI